MEPETRASSPSIVSVRANVLNLLVTFLDSLQGGVFRSSMRDSILKFHQAHFTTLVKNATLEDACFLLSGSVAMLEDKPVHIPDDEKSIHNEYRTQKYKNRIVKFALLHAVGQHTRPLLGKPTLRNGASSALILLSSLINKETNDTSYEIFQHALQLSPAALLSSLSLPEHISTFGNDPEYKTSIQVVQSVLDNITKYPYNTTYGSPSMAIQNRDGAHSVAGNISLAEPKKTVRRPPSLSTTPSSNPGLQLPSSSAPLITPIVEENETQATSAQPLTPVHGSSSSSQLIGSSSTATDATHVPTPAKQPQPTTAVTQTPSQPTKPPTTPAVTSPSVPSVTSPSVASPTPHGTTTTTESSPAVPVKQGFVKSMLSKFKPKTLTRTNVDEMEEKQLIKRGALFGRSLDELIANDMADESCVPYFLIIIGQYLMDPAQESLCETEGIFRIAGHVNQVTQLKHILDYTQAFALEWDVHVLTSIIRLWLRELPEPLIPRQLQTPLLQASCDNQEQLIFTLLNSTSISPAQRATLHYILRIGAYLTADRFRKFNQMSTQSMAVVLAPNIFRLQPSQGGIARAQQDLSSAIAILMLLMESVRSETTPKGAQFSQSGGDITETVTVAETGMVIAQMDENEYPELNDAYLRAPRATSTQPSSPMVRPSQPPEGFASPAPPALQSSSMTTTPSGPRGSIMENSAFNSNVLNEPRSQYLRRPTLASGQTYEEAQVKKPLSSIRTENTESVCIDIDGDDLYTYMHNAGLGSPTASELEGRNVVISTVLLSNVDESTGLHVPESSSQYRNKKKTTQFSFDQHGKCIDTENQVEIYDPRKSTTSSQQTPTMLPSSIGRQSTLPKATAGRDRATHNTLNTIPVIEPLNTQQNMVTLKRAVDNATKLNTGSSSATTTTTKDTASLPSGGAVSVTPQIGGGGGGPRANALANANTTTFNSARSVDTNNTTYTTNSATSITNIDDELRVAPAYAVPIKRRSVNSNTERNTTIARRASTLNQGPNATTLATVAEPDVLGHDDNLRHSSSSAVSSGGNPSSTPAPAPAWFDANYSPSTGPSIGGQSTPALSLQQQQQHRRRMGYPGSQLSPGPISISRRPQQPQPSAPVPSTLASSLSKPSYYVPGGGKSYGGGSSMLVGSLLLSTRQTSASTAFPQSSDQIRPSPLQHLKNLKHTNSSNDVFDRYNSPDNKNTTSSLNNNNNTNESSSIFDPLPEDQAPSSSPIPPTPAAPPTVSVPLPSTFNPVKIQTFRNHRVSIDLSTNAIISADIDGPGPNPATADLDAIQDINEEDEHFDDDDDDDIDNHRTSQLFSPRAGQGRSSIASPSGPFSPRGGILAQHALPGTTPHRESIHTRRTSSAVIDDSKLGMIAQSTGRDLHTVRQRGPSFLPPTDPDALTIGWVQYPNDDGTSFYHHADTNTTSFIRPCWRNRDQVHLFPTSKK